MESIPPRSWIETNRAAIRHNVETFRRLAGSERALMLVVKANAYGHGMVGVAQAGLRAGADWLAVFAVEEALALRAAGLDAPILVLGPTPAEALAVAAAQHLHLTVANPEAARQMREAQITGLSAHIKLETGTQRQGFQAEDLGEIAALAAAGVNVSGLYSHYADIEDTTDHSFAREQLATFQRRVSELAGMGIRPPHLHTACTAATLLFPETFFNLVRVGIGLYGLWPSRETMISVRETGREAVRLEPVMTWKTRVAELKWVEADSTVGYGRTFKATRRTRLAILPVGYANGFDRRLSNSAHVLLRGRRAKLCGRVMMNMTIVDATDVPEAQVGDEVVLLGAQGEERVSAETMASWVGTINYEIVTRAEPVGARLFT